MPSVADGAHILPSLAGHAKQMIHAAPRKVMPASRQIHIVTRFAPSPTGLLHLGHAFAALFAAEAAEQAGGRFLLRIEDIDIGRCRAEFEAAIDEDLGWLGLDWERPVRRQSEHMADYADALGRLEALGVLYPCFCTRKQIRDEIARSPAAPHGVDGPVYPGTCRRLSPGERADRVQVGEAHALRLDLAAAVPLAQELNGGPLTWHDREQGKQAYAPEEHGDVVLARKDVPTSYHLAVTVDDALQEVTLVTRGRDLFDASHVHRVLQALLELPVPDYHHHRLISTAAGQRFAKRDQAATLRALRESGATPADVREMLARTSKDEAVSRTSD
jgi:glutamyl-Q tRNA(Asp) synthetase